MRVATILLLGRELATYINMITSALVGLRRHSPDELHGVMAILDLEVLLQFKVMMLTQNGFLASFPKDFLPLLFGHKLGAFVEGCRAANNARLKRSVEHSGQRSGYCQAVVSGVFQVLPERYSTVRDQNDEGTKLEANHS